MSGRSDMPEALSGIIVASGRSDMSDAMPGIVVVPSGRSDDRDKIRVDSKVETVMLARIGSNDS